MCKWKRNNIKTASDLIVCNKYNTDSMKLNYRKCPSQNRKFIEEELDLDVEQVSINQWNKGKLEENTLEAKHFINELILQLTTLFKHIYNVFSSKRAKKSKRWFTAWPVVNAD
ncbi:hypothetical protein AVEN_106086-1 [Araneus ventricosus]|uniref:Uncharacterized protein n=1 Tax=Araneus ventricosus TaxID=182803 RepID=A0A4Y2SA12_ARAVE|nr:hypothetical protein AVEN_45220-1 [Araneus ventricosus]GBN84673.1 hypothetical protein AVEN_106086-1 [Araneus ventricosus]